MSLMRALAQHYATLSLTVPPERFTEGQRSQLDTHPAIVYGLSTEEEELIQDGVGPTQTFVQMTVWSETPAQGARIAKELRDNFHLIHLQTIGSGEDAVFVKLSRLDNQADLTEYPRDGSAPFICSRVLNFLFHHQLPMPQPQGS